MTEATAGSINTPSTVRESAGYDRRTQPVIPYSLAMVSVVLMYWTVDIVSPALPAIRADLGLTATGAGLVFSMMFLGRLVGNFPATHFLDRAGAPVTALAGSAGLAAGSLMAALAPGSVVLLSGRFLQGVGLALVINAAMRSILHSRPAEGAAMTWFGVASMIGGLCGLAISGVLTERLGWESVFFWSAGLGVAAGGFALLAIWRGSRGKARPQQAAQRVEAMPVGLRTLALPLALNFSAYISYCVWVVLPLFAERKFNASAEQTASLLMVITAVHLFAALPVGRAIRRAGSPRVLVAGFACAMLGTMLVPVAPNLLWLAIPLGLYGVGQVASATAGGDIVLRRGHATNRSIGLLRFSSDLGLVVGPVFAGALVDWFGYRTPYIALPLMLLVSAVLASKLVRGSGAGRQ